MPDAGMHFHLASAWLIFTLLLQVASTGVTSSASRLPSQTPTISTLPPAQPSSGSSDPCNFGDRTTLLDRVVNNWQGYNVSLLVEKCPGVCILIYGDGNPDVSGVGAMASYYIQFISTILIGPVVHLLMMYDQGLSKPGSHLSQFLNMLRTDVIWEVNLGNSYIMLALMIAAAARVSQSPPVFELDFIAYLAVLQLFMAIGRSAIMAVFLQDDQELKFKTGLMHNSTVIGALFAFFLNIGGYPSGTQSEALVAISQFCTYANDLRIPIYEPVKPDDQSYLNWWETILLSFSVPIVFVLGSFILLVIATVMMAISSAQGFILTILPEPLKEKSKVLFTRYFRPVIHWTVRMITYISKLVMKVVSFVLALLPVILWAIWVASCIIFLVYMQKSRRSLEKALGKQYLDTQWGFGQITSILMWLPTLFQVLGKIYAFRPTTEVYDDQAQSLLRSSQDNMGLEALSSAISFNSAVDEVSTNPSAEPLSSTDLPFQTTRIEDLSPNPTSASNTEEEVFELRQRETWPRSQDGNYLPL